MTTNQNMIRKMGNYEIIQRTLDGYFEANALLRQWNNDIQHEDKREMNKFLSSEKTKEFIETIVERENEKSIFRDFGELQVVIKGKTRGLLHGGSLPASVWMHPLLFIDFAMWINPRFKYDVLKFVFDEMIKYRHEAGDEYRTLAAAIQKIVKKDFIYPAMSKIAEGLNWVIFNSHEPAIRNKFGDEDKQRELSTLEKKLADLINEGFLTNFDQVLNYLRKRYNEKNYPKVFAT
ncbi:MAG: KilA-N domain-containing protein [Tannerella sp.]|jgi:hypothetical protein|nr:KilA-N domain-containing protein [Tannerella sp.]